MRTPLVVRTGPLLLLAGVAAAGPAQAEPASRKDGTSVPARPRAPAPWPFKRPPADTSLEVLQLLARAERLSAAGDYDGAARLYRGSTRADSRALVSYQWAVAAERAERFRTAIDQYRAYLAAGPAPDRAQVLGRIAELTRRRPRRTRIGMSHLTPRELSDHQARAVLIIDGRQVVPAPAEVFLGAGRHLVARITASTYGATYVEGADGGWDQVEELGVQPVRAEGNVVIHDHLDQGTRSFTSDGIRFTTGTRMRLPAGRYELAGFGLCKPLSFRVGDDRTFTFVQLRPAAGQALDRSILEDGRRLEPGAPCVRAELRVVTVPLPEVTP